jgi:hypothetical protein
MLEGETSAIRNNGRTVASSAPQNHVTPWAYIKYVQFLDDKSHLWLRYFCSRRDFEGYSLQIHSLPYVLYNKDACRRLVPDVR